jgi:hypothetical protein
MPVWPKNVYTFGVNLLTAAAEWKVRRRQGAPARQERTRAALVDRLAATSFWREAGVEPGMSQAAFRRQVAPCTYE